ncbi:DUF4328 domain-containing protein [Streptomyces sp. TRM 70351]|uniref:protein kinase domain-containing protein n=1 Tax=Streptomyces sp. TRM 70351 TaxID=3116552 RepID=UPI002E7AB683|nr:DUF4328 domain-containing protein [Streptomyces sp. TRM 70351]MEE1927165.1 DUF4328 domain-containing protein [Streptomyces sp. TRM 70351]
MWPLDQADPVRIGPYRLLARLGEGGMGTVFLAEGDGGERVALKSIRHGYAEEPGFRARFAREIQTAGMVRAEGVARVVNAEPGDGGQRPWVATEFVPGVSLQRLVATQGPLPARSAGALAVGLARALGAVHAAGLVHRDVKPSNILLTVEGPRLIDFGVARLVDASTGGGLTRTGASVGSPGYMSPEQVLGRSLAPASDVFGLGGVLVFAATGDLPFPVEDASSQHALMFAVVQQDPSLGRVPAELRATVAECLAKEPAGRPPAPALAERLSAYAAVLDDGAKAPGGEPWLPARALAEVARISGRAVAQGEWRPAGGGAGGPGDGGGGGAGEPAAPARPAAPPPPPGGLPYVPTLTAPAGSAPQAPPHAPPPAPAPEPPAVRPGPAGQSAPGRPHYVRPEPAAAPRPPHAPVHRAPVPPASPWATRPTALHSPEGMATALSWVYGIYLAFKCVAAVLHVGFAGELGDWRTADFALWTDIDELVRNAATVVLADSLLGLAAGVLTLTWFWRVRVNAEVFAPGEHRYSPGMAVGSWFIPLANLVIPGKIAFDVWYASLQDRDRGGPGQRGWQTSRWWPGRRLLAWWWACFVLLSLALCVTLLVPDLLEASVDRGNGIIDFDRMIAVSYWAAFLHLLCVPGIALSVSVIRRLTELQELRAVRR